jgi:hypothetical protein
LAARCNRVNRDSASSTALHALWYQIVSFGQEVRTYFGMVVPG